MPTHPYVVQPMKAYIELTVPDGATVFIDGMKTVSTGTVRTYDTPAYAPGTKLTYEVEVRLGGVQRKQTVVATVGQPNKTTIKFAEVLDVAPPNKPNK